MPSGSMVIVRLIADLVRVAAPCAGVGKARKQSLDG